MNYKNTIWPYRLSPLKSKNFWCSFFYCKPCHQLGKLWHKTWPTERYRHGQYFQDLVRIIWMIKSFKFTKSLKFACFLSFRRWVLRQSKTVNIYQKLLDGITLLFCQKLQKAWRKYGSFTIGPKQIGEVCHTFYCNLKKFN